MQDASGIGTRDLTPDEKAVVSHAVGLSVSNPNSAQFKWPQIANTEDGNINYCGMVKANSPYGPYSGWQAYIVEGKIAGGKLSTAVVGLIAGGKDVEIVRKMCKKYGLDPARPANRCDVFLRASAAGFAPILPNRFSLLLKTRADARLSTWAQRRAPVHAGWFAAYDVCWGARNRPLQRSVLGSRSLSGYHVTLLKKRRG